MRVRGKGVLCEGEGVMCERDIRVVKHNGGLCPPHNPVRMQSVWRSVQSSLCNRQGLASPLSAQPCSTAWPRWPLQLPS